MITMILKALLNIFYMVVSFVVNLLPDSPFRFEAIDIPNWVTWVCYFIPVSEMVISMEVFLVAVAVYYSYRMILRWSKMIS